MHLLNLIFSCTGIVFNVVLLIILFVIDRRRCATYFLLIVMTTCDIVYCLVYLSIWLTNDYYLNVINHQILCPLSFFLSPFAFTGSTLLLLIALIHLITNFERKYDTVVGQIRGRLSAVFAVAFIIIRSVLGSTSIELVDDSTMPGIQYCTVDMNTPMIVSKVQTINHIFAEVTDILVYCGWIFLLVAHALSIILCQKKSLEHSKTTKMSIRFVTNLSIKDADDSDNCSLRMDVSNRIIQRNRNKEKHNDLATIIIAITSFSILFYFPIMLNKFSTMELIYRGKTLLSHPQIIFLQDIQQAVHLFCLTIRFLPYFIFDRKIRSFINSMIGFRIQHKSTSIRKPSLHKIAFRCRCCWQH